MQYCIYISCTYNVRSMYPEPKIQVSRSSTAGFATIFRNGRQCGCGRLIGFESRLGVPYQSEPVLVSELSGVRLGKSSRALLSVLI